MTTEDKIADHEQQQRLMDAMRYAYDRGMSVQQIAETLARTLRAIANQCLLDAEHLGELAARTATYDKLIDVAEYIEAPYVAEGATQ